MTSSSQHNVPRPAVAQPLVMTWSTRMDTRGDLRVIRAAWSAAQPSA